MTLCCRCKVQANEPERAENLKGSLKFSAILESCEESGLAAHHGPYLVMADAG